MGHLGAVDELLCVALSLGNGVAGAVMNRGPVDARLGDTDRIQRARQYLDPALPALPRQVFLAAHRFQIDEKSVVTLTLGGPQRPVAQVVVVAPCLEVAFRHSVGDGDGEHIRLKCQGGSGDPCDVEVRCVVGDGALLPAAVHLVVFGRCRVCRLEGEQGGGGQGQHHEAPDGASRPGVAARRRQAGSGLINHR